MLFAKKISLKSIICFLIGMLLLTACSKEKHFTFPIQEIKSIKEFDYKNQPYYDDLILTPEYYKSSAFNRKQELIASFMYKNKKASVRLVFDYSNKVIKFIRIGEESDYFVFAISELFEEKTAPFKMKESIVCDFYDGEPKDFSLLSGKQRYKLSYAPNKDTESGSVQMTIFADLSIGEIKLGEKNAGLAKRNFVNTFKK